MNSTPHQLTENVKLLQKAVLVHGGKFLILKRSSNSFSRPDQWDLPGGNSEWPAGEVDIKDVHRGDLVREIFEETGIEVSENEVTNCVHAGSYFEEKKQIFTVVLGWNIVLPASFSESEVLISDEHSEFKWITKEEFEGFDFGFAGAEGGFIRAMILGNN